LRKLFRTAKGKAGYPSVSLNTFGRHSKGYQLKLAGATDEQIADILANTPQVVRATYTHVEAGGKAKILQLLEKPSNGELTRQGQPGTSKKAVSC
jgi:hypothetical protein